MEIIIFLKPNHQKMKNKKLLYLAVEDSIWFRLTKFMFMMPSCSETIFLQNIMYFTEVKYFI